MLDLLGDFIIAGIILIVAIRLLGKFISWVWEA